MRVPVAGETMLEERLDQLTRLSSLARAVGRAKSLGEACDAALACVLETLSPDRAAVLLFDARGVMRFRAWQGLSQSYRLATEGHSPWSRETDDPPPVLVPHVANAPDLAELRATIEGEGIRALGFFPLADSGRLLGKLMVYYDTPHAFSPIEVRLGQAIGAHVALEIARGQRENHADFLAQASRVLARSLDSGVTLRRIAELSVPFLSDRCEIHAEGPDGLERVALARVDAAGPPTLPLEEGVKAVISAGRPKLIDASAALGSALIVPLRTRGRVLGAMSFVAAPGRRPFDDDDREVALELARRAALAVDNAYLHEAEQRARNTTERFHGVAVALAEARTKTDVANVIVRGGAAAVGAAAGWVTELDEAASRLATLSELGYDIRSARRLDGLPIDSAHPVADAARENRALWLESSAEVIAAYPSLADDPWAESFEALAVVPLPAAGRSIGAIALGFRREHAFRDHERRLLLGLAAQSGQALERASLYARLQERADAASVLAHVGDGVFRLDAGERVTSWNRGASAITGIDEHEALGRPIQELVANWRELRPRISITAAPLAVGRRRALPVRIRERDLSLAISGVAAGEGVVFAFRDVTESERLEQSRRDFVTTASHELRTPLAGVFGATKTLLHRDLDPATHRTMLELIDSQSQRLAEILDDFLAVSRLDAGKAGMRIADHELAPILADVVALERARAPEGIEIVHKPTRGLRRVRCDAEKLRQVLVNLVDNAVKYSPDGGKITVAASAGADTVRITVADEGLGIPSAAREHVFEKFFRLDPQLARGVGGTGLGLYISREFVTQMQGRVWIDPDRDGGSAFHVELPVASAARSLRRPARTSP